MATSKSKGELVIPIISVQSSLLLGHPFVPKIVHVAQMKVTVNLMTCASQEQAVDQKIVQLLRPVLHVFSCFQMLIVVLHRKHAKTRGKPKIASETRKKDAVARKK